jgi:hypothetical protein
MNQLGRKGVILRKRMYESRFPLQDKHKIKHNRRQSQSADSESVEVPVDSYIHPKKIFLAPDRFF